MHKIRPSQGNDKLKDWQQHCYGGYTGAPDGHRDGHERRKRGHYRASDRYLRKSRPMDADALALGAPGFCAADVAPKKPKPAPTAKPPAESYAPSGMTQRKGFWKTVECVMCFGPMQRRVRPWRDKKPHLTCSPLCSFWLRRMHANRNNRTYRRVHRAALLEYQRKWRESNKAKVRGYRDRTRGRKGSARGLAGKDARLAWWRDYYRRNADAERKRSRIVYHARISAQYALNLLLHETGRAA